VSQNNQFDRRGASYDVRRPFKIKGTTYEIAGLTASGDGFPIRTLGPHGRRDPAATGPEPGSEGGPVHGADHRSPHLIHGMWTLASRSLAISATCARQVRTAS
jgi:hypothetical protein